MENLMLKPTAVGSLPFANPQKAIDFIFDNFKDIPFWPQLANVNRYEDMVMQYSQMLPGLVYDSEGCRFYFDKTTDVFFEQLEQFYMDYESIISENNEELLDKYGITEPFTSTIPMFLNKIAKTKPEFAKGHIIGPFTWAVSLTDEEGKCAFFDETLRDIIVKALALKALWQVKMMKEASSETTPIIFMDEPALSQYGTSAFVTVKKEEIVAVINEISDLVKEKGALSAVHCCSKVDWELLYETGIDIVNFDAFSYASCLNVYHKQVKAFIEQGGYIAWGVAPTLDDETLAKVTLSDLEAKFENCVSLLCEKGCDEKMLLEQSFFTPTCGAGGLSNELAEKAMTLTIDLANSMSKKYKSEVF